MFLRVSFHLGPSSRSELITRLPCTLAKVSFAYSTSAPQAFPPSNVSNNLLFVALFPVAVEIVITACSLLAIGSVYCSWADLRSQEKENSDVKPRASGLARQFVKVVLITHALWVCATNPG